MRESEAAAPSSAAARTSPPAGIARPLTRYYLALEPPSELRAALGRLMRSLGAHHPVPHVTLIAPPDLSDDRAWLEPAARVARATAPFLVRLGPLDSFDDRVLFLAVDSPEAVLLRDRLVEALELEVRGADFVPHLTLAQASRRRPLPALSDEDVVPVMGQPFSAEALYVFAQDEPDRPYRAERSLPFAPYVSATC